MRDSYLTLLGHSMNDLILRQQESCRRMRRRMYHPRMNFSFCSDPGTAFSTVLIIGIIKVMRSK